MTIGNAKKKMFSFQQFVNRLGDFTREKKEIIWKIAPQFYFFTITTFTILVHTLKRCFDI
jgi:hypothetical protein